MDVEELERDRTIDPGQLDVEAVRQADVFFKWAERAVAAKAEVDRQKLALDVLDASLQFKVRNKPENYGIARVTEVSIGAAVIMSKRRVEAANALLRAKEQAALHDAAREAMEQRKRMLEILVTLHGQEYFAGPSVPRDLVSAWQEHQQRSEGRVNERQMDRARKRKEHHKRVRREV